MDFNAALSALIKSQCQFPDPAAILALANMKFPLNYGLSNYVHSPIQSRQQGGMPPIDIAGLIAAEASHEPDVKMVASLASAFRTPTPVTSVPSTLPQLPCPIPAQPSSPSQSSASASSMSSSGSLSQSTQNSPISGRSSTPTIAGFKRKWSGTPIRKPPAPIPEEKKDEAYFERRRKNNDAAKRSRDARRMKEEQTAAKASFLEQENLQLRTQNEMLRTELANLQMVVLQLPTTANNFPIVKDETTDDSRSDSANFNSGKAVVI